MLLTMKYSGKGFQGFDIAVPASCMFSSALAPLTALLCSMLLTMKYYGKRYPKLKWMRPLGPISACVIAIIAAVAGDLENRGIRIVGKIPKGEFAYVCEEGWGCWQAKQVMLVTLLLS
jgi:MFS superfamily sulfate permease-like transporter